MCMVVFVLFRTISTHRLESQDEKRLSPHLRKRTESSFKHEKKWSLQPNCVPEIALHAGYQYIF